jgi:hypothetical protein
MNHSSFNTWKAGTLLLTIVVVVGFSAAFAQSKRNRAAKEFMREKLELSQRVLEGLAIEDYDLIITKGARLSSMSKEADWRVFENPDYDQQSVIFRRQVDSLVRSAKEKNLDAATLAYVRVTMSCVDCHKLVRGKLVASVHGLQPTALARASEAGFERNRCRQETASSHQAWHSVLRDEHPCSP